MVVLGGGLFLMSEVTLYTLNLITRHDIPNPVGKAGGADTTEEVEGSGSASRTATSDGGVQTVFIVAFTLFCWAGWAGRHYGGSREWCRP